VPRSRKHTAFAEVLDDGRYGTGAPGDYDTARPVEVFAKGVAVAIRDPNGRCPLDVVTQCTGVYV